jgi:predicted MFS family arabinose efflux permease
VRTGANSLNADHRLTRSQEIALTVVAAVVTANAYYIHPIVSDVAAHFRVSHAEIGIVPALNQLALAIGIFLLLPLGDRFSNKRLTIIFAAGQTLSMLVMAMAQDFALFTAGSTSLGFFTIAPYLLPAYASKRVAPERLGQVTALLTAGVILGILIARVGAGIVTELYGWRVVYWIATGLMAAITLALPFLMREREKDSPVAAPYHRLVLSLFPLVRQHPEVLLSGAIQALNFGGFIALWLGLALHLTSAEMGYGVDTVGYLAAIAAVSIASTPRLGRWADHIGARRARFVFAVIQLGGLLLFYPLGGSLWLLLIPMVIGNLVGPAIDVTSRMTYLTLAPGLRTRLTTIYVVMMFIGGGIGSIAGTWVYDHYHWAGTCVLLGSTSAAATLLTFIGWKRFGQN